MFVVSKSQVSTGGKELSLALTCTEPTSTAVRSYLVTELLCHLVQLWSDHLQWDGKSDKHPWLQSIAPHQRGPAHKIAC
jgi:hypothetical protein